METLLTACPGCHREQHGRGLPADVSSRMCDRHLLGMYRQLATMQLRMIKVQRTGAAVLNEENESLRAAIMALSNRVTELERPRSRIV